MVVPFGTRRARERAAGTDLPAWLAELAPGARWSIRAIATGLEDVFIAAAPRQADRDSH